MFYLAAWLVLPDQNNSIALESFLDKRGTGPEQPSPAGSRRRPLFSAPAPAGTGARAPLPAMAGAPFVTVCVLPHTHH